MRTPGSRPNVERDYQIDANGCWIWQGHIDANGYGKAYDPDLPRGHRLDWAHRVAFRRAGGVFPSGGTRYEIDHVCQVTACINPDHLELVTKVEHARRTFMRLGKDDLHSKAAVLRTQGLTYEEIAQVLGYTARTGAHHAVRSAVAKGLVSADDVPAKATLTEEDRADIRALYQLGIPQTEIGSWYGVDSSQISRICSGKSSGWAA